jgi:putative selenate reductase
MYRAPTEGDERMSETMKIQPFDHLLRWILKELNENQSLFDIHRSAFYKPKADSPFATPNLFGHYLATPIGPAAGPHTQLTQNILCSWLTGGRFIELKTVQIMDELEIPRPCIDMEDEGYNVEWSQELKLAESTEEYVKAWALVHILRRILGFEELPFGTIFNMSVGYDLAGITSPPMLAFMDKMEDASEEIAAIRAILQDQFPQFADIEIPPRLTNSVTLSTMHGCPPDEIEQIARYMLEERGMHTVVKLNPTLLGKERVLEILHDDLKYTAIHIPDAVFEHDLQYDRAVALINSLQEVASERNLVFGVKLSNTLAMANHREVLPGDEMYMSGRSLYPITMNLFNKLAKEFGDPSAGSGQGLYVSYSAGADAFNVATVLSTGALPVTVASDLLKPGGYARFPQYLENLEAEMRAQNARSLEALAQDKIANLERAAAEALENPRYKKGYFPYGLPKVASGLGLFDCVDAPCVEQCAVYQDVPEYAWLIAQGEYDRALEVILARNPLPAVTGYVCTELCKTRCTRNDYEEPVAIRALKRFAVEHGKVPYAAGEKSGKKVAIIGSGPSGLAAAAFLTLNGVQVTIFEAKEQVGGMLRMVPVFRLPWSVIQEDVDRITAMGVEIKTSHRITKPPEELLQDGFDAVYVASGFQRDTPLYIEGIEGEGVYAALDLLERARQGKTVDLGSKALVIGGGDTAMDAVRVAKRYTGTPATLVYRRTAKEMPANEEEIEGAFEEGTVLHELASPARVIRENGRVVALECIQNRLGEPGADGRRRPVPIEGSEFRIEADSVVVAIGQSPELSFLDGSSVTLHANGSIAADPETGQAGTPHVYAGGDVVVGPDSIIAACGDGRRAAEAICAEFGIDFQQSPATPAVLSEDEIFQMKLVRGRRVPKNQSEMIPPPERVGFELIEATLSEKAAQAEALRCVQCSTYCDKCVEVCPNRSNFTFKITPVSQMVPQLACQGEKLAVVGQEPFVVAQDRQILHVDDFCNECDNCATFCVHQGEPYRDKPRLFLKATDFRLETENAFYIEGDTIRRIEEGRESLLAVEAGGRMTFENDNLHVTLSPAFEIGDMALKTTFDGVFSLREAAEMKVVLDGVRNFLSFLLPDR